MAAAPAPHAPTVKPKLIYFNYDGGRGETIRQMLYLAGVEFTDERIDFSAWPQKKASTPYGCLPLLEWNGHVLAESNAIMRFIGRQSNLYPTDLLDGARVDELMDACEGIATKFQPTMQIPAGPERLAKRKEIAEGPLLHVLKHFDKLLASAPAPAAGGIKYFVGSTLTVADLKVFALLRWIASGTLDGVGASQLTPHPNLVAFKSAMEGHPKLSEWLSKHQLTAKPH